MTKNLEELLRKFGIDIVNRAMVELHQAHLQHYEGEEREEVRKRLETLIQLTARCMAAREAEPIVKHAERIARERFASGYDLSEVQTSINVLEETLNRRVVSSLSPDEVAGALSLVSAIFTLTKDRLAQTYVELTANRANATEQAAKNAYRDDSPKR